MPKSMDKLFAIMDECVTDSIVSEWLDERSPARGREKGKQVVSRFCKAVGQAALAGYTALDCNIAFVRSFAEHSSPDVVRSLKSRVLCMFAHPQSDAIAADWSRGNLERYAPSKVEDRVRTARRWVDPRKALEAVMSFVSLPVKIIGERMTAETLRAAADLLDARAEAAEAAEATDTDTDTDN